MTESIVIRRCESVDDYRACQEAQRRAWGISEDGYLVPVATMVGAQLHGGLVLGAFLPDGSAAGVSFAFLGTIGERLGLYSQLTGVVPEYQGIGLGERLKHLQRDAARAAGLSVIAWAFDPLQAGNAHFNLARLGATCSRYVVDMYGPRTDALNVGVPTDRLIAEWETEDEEAPFQAGEWSRVRRLDASVSRDTVTDDRLLLEIPERIASLRQDDPDQARDWLAHTRRGFLWAFEQGYRAVGFLRQGEGESRRSYYALDRSEPLLTGRRG